MLGMGTSKTCFKKSWEGNRGYFADYGSQRLLNCTKDVLFSKRKQHQFLHGEQRKKMTQLLVAESSECKEDYMDE